MSRKNNIKPWNYDGDVNLCYGGFYWREDGSDDYVLCVEVTPYSEVGGADNLFIVESGSLYMPVDDDVRRKSALDIIGITETETVKATRAQLVAAFRAHHGTDENLYLMVAIGKVDHKLYAPEADVTLRANASLRNYVENNYVIGA